MNERLIDLVNREIDGLLTADEQRELHQTVQADPDAGRFYENHKYAAGLLKKIPVATVPPSLKNNIMSAVHKVAAPNPSKIKVRKPRFSFARFFQPSSAFPLAVGMAAGVVLTVIFWGNGEILSPDGSGMAGTLVDWSSNSKINGPAPVAISAGGTEISARWANSRTNAVIFIDAISDREAIINLHTVSSEFPILSVAQQIPGSGGIHAGAGIVEITHSGTNSYAVAIDRGDSRNLPVEISVTVNGQSISQSLTIEWE